METQLVRLVGTYLAGPTDDVVEVRLSRKQRVRRLGKVVVKGARLLVTERPASAGVLPLRLRRQAVHPAALLGPLVQFRQKQLRVVPRYVLDREPLQFLIRNALDRIL